MKKLYGYYGGSRLHGFPLTEKSDWDYYSVGTSKFIKPYKMYPNIKIHQKKRSEALDVEKTELCSFITYLMNGFVFQVEAMFVPKNWMDYLDPKFEELVLKNRHKLIDRCSLIENFGSNIETVRRKTAPDIAKLKEMVLATKPSRKIVQGVSKMYDEYARKGYYHKDYLHHIRIAASILGFLKNDFYPLELGKTDPKSFEICSDIKLNPDKYARKDLDEILDSYIKDIQTFNLENDEDKWCFDGPYAQSVINSFYP